MDDIPEKELQAGYDSHQLAKAVDQMCEQAELPDVMNFVVAPTKPLAVLLTNLTRPGVRVVTELDGNPHQFVEYTGTGGYFAGYTASGIPWDETLDLRLDGSGQ